MARDFYSLGPMHPRRALFGAVIALCIPRATVTKGGRPRPEPHERPELGDRPVRLRGLLRRPRLGCGQPAPQHFVLGLEDLDGGSEDTQKRIALAEGRGAEQNAGA